MEALNATSDTREADANAVSGRQNSAWESLPVELHTEILKILVFKGIEPFTEEDYDDNQAACTNLVHLCLVSNRLCEVVRPELYRNIIIHRPIVLVRMYRTLLDKPELGALTRRVSFGILKMFEYEQPDMHPLRRVHGAQPQDRLPSAMLTETNKLKLQLLYILQFKVLGLMTRLSDLALAAPRRIFAHLPTQTIYGGPETAPSALDIAYCSVLQGDSCPILPGLKVVRFIGDLDFSTWLPIEMCKSFLALPHVQSLVWVNASPLWFRLMGDWERDPSNERGNNWKCPNIKSFAIHNSHLPPDSDGVVDIPLAFPSLESISIHGRADKPRNIWYQSPQGGSKMRLQDSLARLNNLHTLKLDLPEFELEHVLGRPGILRLNNLTTLLKVSAPLHFFVNRKTGHDFQLVDPSLILPPSLQCLNITMNDASLKAWSSAAVRFSYDFMPGTWLIQFLEGILLLRNQKSLAKLEEVVCDWDPAGSNQNERNLWPGEDSSTSSSEVEDEDSEFHAALEKIQNSFEQQGVYFEMN